MPVDYESINYLQLFSFLKQLFQALKSISFAAYSPEFKAAFLGAISILTSGPERY